MLQIRAYKTRDGKVFETLKEVKKHAEARYSDALFKLANGLTMLNTHRVVEELDALGGPLNDLQALKADTEITNEEDEDAA